MFKSAHDNNGKEGNKEEFTKLCFHRKFNLCNSDFKSDVMPRYLCGIFIHRIFIFFVGWILGWAVLYGG